jgi:hypothetical protein
MNKETLHDENRLVANEWKAFSATTAYRKLMDYIEFQDYAAVQSAKGPVLTFSDDDGAQINFDPQKAASLLQRSVGYDIIKTYIESYVNFTTKS